MANEYEHVPLRKPPQSAGFVPEWLLDREGAGGSMPSTEGAPFEEQPIPLSPPPRTRPRYINAEQAARYLGGLNSRTVSRWAREGYLPAIPIGEGKLRLWRFVEADLDSWMEHRRGLVRNVA